MQRSDQALSLAGKRYGFRHLKISTRSKNKEDRFRRIAAKGAKRVLEGLRRLGTAQTKAIVHTVKQIQKKYLLLLERKKNEQNPYS